MSGITAALRLFFITGVLTAIAGGFASRAALAQQSTNATAIPVSGQFKAPLSDKDGKPRGISGMACLGKSGDATRECFVINDEERFGEVATLTAEGLAPTGKTVIFVVKDEAGTDVLGVPRNPMCKDKQGVVDSKGKFGELDGEGVAVADDDFVYVASSHSCSGGGKFKPSSFLVTRFRLNSATSFIGASPPSVERSWRLADALLASDKVRAAFGKPKGEGTNIEGVAVIGGRLYAGLRTPVAADTAFIVSAPVKDLFAPGSDGLGDGVVKTTEVKLGPNAGIRDLAALKNGKLLILSGPTVDQDVPYQLWLLDQPDAGIPLHGPVTVTTPKKDPDGKTAKAETVAVIGEDTGKLKVLVLYDNIDEGAPMQHEITLP